jgi:Fur family peroxide stress response transcriptional regulator
MIRRETKQREAILNVLRQADSHPTADRIYDRVRKEIPNISKGTVYRNLKLLKEMGEISELYLAGTVSRYEGRREKHYHFGCEKCGRVFDLDEPVNNELDDRVARRTGFLVDYHQLEFRGLCKDCLQKTRAETGENKHE